MSQLTVSLILGVYFIGALITGVWMWKDADPIGEAREEDSAAMAGFTFIMMVFVVLVFTFLWPLFVAVLAVGYAIIWPIGKLLKR